MNKGQILLLDLLKIINIHINLSDLDQFTIDRDILLQDNIIKKYHDMIPKLKEYYCSDMMNCLHKNSIKRQPFPAINMLRQILKANKFKLEPKTISMGYDKATGKKNVKRLFVIKNI